MWIYKGKMNATGENFQIQDLSPQPPSDWPPPLFRAKNNQGMWSYLEMKWLPVPVQIFFPWNYGILSVRQHCSSVLRTVLNSLVVLIKVLVKLSHIFVQMRFALRALHRGKYGVSGSELVEMFHSFNRREAAISMRAPDDIVWNQDFRKLDFHYDIQRDG